MALTFNIDGVVRGGVQRLRYGSGTNKNANPQRPTMAMGNGRLTIAGYRTNLRKKLVVYEGTVKELECWIQNEKYDEVTGYSQYDLQGLLVQAGRSQVEISQNSATANANQAAVTNLMRNAFGLNSMQVSLPSTPLADYEYNGPAAGYASNFGQVSGGLPYETNTGLLGIKSPFRVPTSLTGTFSERDYRIRSILTEFDQTQLWNKALIQYDGPETNHSGSGSGSVKDPGAGGASGVVTDLTIANPASGVKIEDMEATLTIGAATGQWKEILGDPGSGNATGTLTDPGQSDLRGVDTNLTLNDPAAGHVIEDMAATMAVGSATGTWQELEGDPGSGNASGTLTDPGQSDLRGVDTNLTLNDPAANHVIEDLAATMTVGAATGTWEEIQGDPHSGNGTGNVSNPGPFGASGVLTGLVIANPDANHRIEDMDATLTVGAASGATYTLNDVTRNVANLSRAVVISSVRDLDAFRLSTSVSLASGERIASATPTITLSISNAESNVPSSSPSAVVEVSGSRMDAYVDIGLESSGADSVYNYFTTTRDISGVEYRLAYRWSDNRWRWVQRSGGTRNVSATVTLQFSWSYIVSNSTVFTLPVPTRRTAPVWEVERVSRSQNPNNRNNSFARVTLVGTDQPGTWRINDSGTNIDVTSWEHSTGGKTYRLGSIAVSFAITWRLRDTRTHTVTPSRLQAPNWIIDRVSRSTDPSNRNRKFVRVTVADAHQPGRWRINDGSNTVDLNSWSYTANRRLYKITGIAVSFAVTWSVRDTREHSVSLTRRTAPNWIVERVSRSTDPTDRNRKYVRVTVANAHEPGTWRLNDGTRNVDLSNWTREANRRIYRISSISVSFAVTWRTRDTRTHLVTPTRRAAPRWDVDRVGLTDNPNNANNRLVRVTLAGTNDPGTWRINDGTRNVDLTSWTREANRREYKILTIAVSFVVKWVLDDENVYTLEAQNDDSIGKWGERELTFPVWFRRTAQAALQSRIDRLAEPRNIHTIEFYMDQRDAAKSRQVAALQPGQYIAVPHVGSIVYIMHSELEVDTQRSDIKRLTCIDTGRAHVPTEPTKALSWRGEALTWRAADNYLTWRQS